jgi:predicted polyphosphate/ATP-dependent NAD kinase
MFAARTRESGVERRLGVIVNPIAGMGGRVGLKGTDGAEVLARARALGAEPLAGARCLRALRRLASEGPCRVVAAPGAMGEDAAAEAGLRPEVLDGGFGDNSGPEDTARAARRMQEAGVDLILFAGGDGTARDVLGAVGAGQPILGVPTGVKMHSAVFGTSPEAAGHVAGHFIRDGEGAIRLREAEVMDLDEAALREGRVAAQLYGTALVPHERGGVQARKGPAMPADEVALDALARQLARGWAQDRLLIFGCGTTTRRLKRALGFDGTLLGVDAVLGGRLIAADASEAQLLRLLSRAVGATVVVSATGGQGFLFGRGNQQISAAVLERVGRENIMVVTGAQKLIALDPPVLRVDSGDADVDAMLAGYIGVHTAPGQRMMMKVVA